MSSSCGTTPDIHLEIQDMTVEAACQSLLRGETDLAFTSDAPAPTPYGRSW